MCRSFSKFLDRFYDLIIYENLNFIDRTNCGDGKYYKFGIDMIKIILIALNLKELE